MKIAGQLQFVATLAMVKLINMIPPSIYFPRIIGRAVVAIIKQHRIIFCDPTGGRFTPNEFKPFGDSIFLALRYFPLSLEAKTRSV
jgi:hypothetical protein